MPLDCTKSSSDNQLTSLPAELCQQENLETLDVGDNPLPSECPEDTDKLLEYLYKQLEEGAGTDNQERD